MRISILEGNAGWVPFWLNRLEKCCEGRQSVFFDEKQLQATPQEYFARQCYVAADADEPSIGFVINYVGDDNIIFNTDYPHPDAPAPEEPVPNMLEQPISEESKREDPLGQLRRPLRLPASSAVATRQKQRHPTIFSLPP